MKKRVCLIVIDSVGIGALPDAKEFGDESAHTLGNIYKANKGLNLPNLYKLGLGNITDARLENNLSPIGSYCRLSEKTKAKDTTCGHWEIAGIIMEEPFKTYPNGFPKDLMDKFEKAIGRKTLGNCPASGTEIIQRLGEEHVKTGYPIVYTSADSVFQVACHEGVIPIEELYKICKIAREMLVGDNLVGRVIARPFTGEQGAYERTKNRKDFAIPPISETILETMEKKGKTTIGIGKIEDIFCNVGITNSNHTTNNVDGIKATIEELKNGNDDLIFTNLVDFDMLYGHRNDAKGYANALEFFDSKLPEIMSALKDEDLLIITADHGCDPTTKGTDHTREYIPAIIYGKNIVSKDLGTRNSFADIGATIYEYLELGKWNIGQSFLSEIKG